MKQQTRRDFCAHACQAASAATLAGALGSVLQACGGGGSSPTSGSNFRSTAPALPMVSGSVASGAITLTIASGSPLAAVGSNFDLNGRVVTGPAVSALRQLQTRFANNILTITL